MKNKDKNPLIDVISMGCSKNLVDSEKLMRRLQAKGYSLRHDPELPEGEYVVVNTCGFIADAKEESINMLLELVTLKQEKKIGKIVVMGCLSQRYMDDLKAELPEIDIWYGKFDWNRFIDSLPDVIDNSEKDVKIKDWERKLTTPPHSTYLKISEGCNRFCAFCAIPLITGRHTSRPVEEILEEVKQLVSEGVKEFNVIAQDLSSYGLDLYGNHKLPELIDRMATIPGVEWIRLHYAYPADFPMEILDVMARHDNVCKYLDIALQHISDPVLTNMRRHVTGEETIRLINEIRRRVPGIKLRTTLMVGFPGEGEVEFEQLRRFVKTAKFERLGAFAYSQEDDTWAAKNLNDEVPEEIKQQRLEEILRLQDNIYQELNAAMVGQRIKILIDRIENGVAVGRSQWDSPDIDFDIYVDNCQAQTGEFVNAIVTEADEFEIRADASL